ncbi:hypothetical protein [Methanobacterium spitsbergense]|uniref:Uncharacterized protein n=1 Tax=Methanobacterium spitsbergense TaxID=2874285 RepID=A0A8T5UKU1_9EURY|nr:hypothetical protein [Methanobacterium spitsbergense]MBZ2164498.1 hypothetical protein [Methanobacterium spitsbergense]
MSNIMIYQLKLECNNCSKHYNLKLPVDEEPELYQEYKDWKCNECKSGELTIIYKKRIE